MSLEENIFNSPAEFGGQIWANEIDYTALDQSAAYPSSALDGGSSSSWIDLFQGSVSKGLDYFIAKDAFQTRTDAAQVPKSYAQQYFRGADGKLYQSNGMPVSGGASAGGNNMLLLIGLVVGAVLLARG